MISAASKRRFAAVGGMAAAAKIGRSAFYRWKSQNMAPKSAKSAIFALSRKNGS
jgi:hypothetical protein